MLVVGSQNININATKATAQNRYVKNVSMFFFISLGFLYVQVFNFSYISVSCTALCFVGRLISYIRETIFF